MNGYVRRWNRGRKRRTAKCSGKKKFASPRSYGNVLETKELPEKLVVYSYPSFKAGLILEYDLDILKEKVEDVDGNFDPYQIAAYTPLHAVEYGNYDVAVCLYSPIKENVALHLFVKMNENGDDVYLSIDPTTNELLYEDYFGWEFDEAVNMLKAQEELVLKLKP